MNKKTLKVYDTCTGKYVDVEVSTEIYEAYMRTGWNIHDNNESFYEHEIQFSALIGGKNDCFENFHEFVTESEDTIETSCKNTLLSDAQSAISHLKKTDKQLLQMIYIKEYSEQKCAELLGTSQQNIHKKKKRILSNINKLLKNRKIKGC